MRYASAPLHPCLQIVLKVVQQCVGTEGVQADYVRAEVLPAFFKHFWVRRMALDPVRSEGGGRGGGRVPAAAAILRGGRG